jgi:hypothetical protein
VTDLLNTNITLKKGDKITMAIIGLLGLALFTVIGVVALPYVILALENTIYFMVLAGGTLLTLLSIWENRTAILYKWKNMARNIRRTIARENPIGVMDTAIERFGTKLTSIAENIQQADAARKQQLDAIKTMRAKAQKEQDLADSAVRLGKGDAEVSRYAVAADRWNASADKLEPMAQMLADVHAKMLAARDVCVNRLEDMKNQREVFKLEYDTMMSGQKAIKSFKSFFGSNPDLEMLQLSIEQIDEQTALAEAEIDQFMHDIKPSLDTAALEKESANQKALDRMKGTKQLTASPIGSTLGLSNIKEAELVAPAGKR